MSGRSGGKSARVGGERAMMEGLEGRALMSVAVGLTPDNSIVRFDTRRPEKVTAATPITGLSAGDRVVGIDFRPANGELYGVVDGTSVDRIIHINLKTGASTNVFNLSVPLAGTEFGVDFNPVPDALRIVSDADQNLRVPFASGATLVDTPLSYAATDANAGANPNVVAAAYINPFAGSTTTTLFGIDSNLDILTTQVPPNAGVLNTRGSLGVNTTGQVGFDIQAAESAEASTGRAFASLNVAGESGSRLYSIDLTTGAATLVGSLPITIRDLSIAPSSNLNGQGVAGLGGWAYGKGK